MKVLFAGPSLYGATADLRGIVVRPPAKQGDVIEAVRDGASVIGLVDGYFGGAAAVWHKEILYALSSGVTVLGASSMGALRAAECFDFGMIPVGTIAAAYVSGALDDDAAVALIHAPPEFGSQPMTEPLVDAEATIDHLEALGCISPAEAASLRFSASDCFFGDRTVDAIAKGAGLDPARTVAVAGLYAQHRIALKQQDALLLVERLRDAPDRREEVRRSWSFVVTPMWRQLFESQTVV
jgi:hypothetical protein